MTKNRLTPVCLITMGLLVSAHAALAQSLVAPEGLTIGPSPNAGLQDHSYRQPDSYVGSLDTSAMQLAPPPIMLPNGSHQPTLQPGETITEFGEWRNVTGSTDAQLGHPYATMPVPGYSTDGTFDTGGSFDTGTNGLRPQYVGPPSVSGPSMSTWTPVVPKTQSTNPYSIKPQDTVNVVLPGAARRPSLHKTPSAARVWRAMGRLR